MRKYFSPRLIILSISSGALIVSGSTAAALSTNDLPSRISNQLKDQSQRVEERKQQFEVTLDSTQLATAINKCETAQVKLGTISTRATELKRRRGTIYGDLVDQLTALDGKLSAQRLPHSDLHTAIDALSTKWAALEGSMAEYTSALDDSRTVDCLADPRGFLSSLAAARKSQIAVLEQNDAFQKQLEVIKTQLTKLKTVVSSDLPDVSLKEDNKLGRD